MPHIKMLRAQGGIRDAELNEAYTLKLNPNEMRQVYISIKQDKGLNVMIYTNERNWKQYCFFLKWVENQ